MSFTSEVNFVDMFLQQDDPFSTDDMYGTKNYEQKDDMNWLNDDFLNSFLDPNFQSFKLSKCNNDIFNTDTSSVNCITENCSDNGGSLSAELTSAKIPNFNTGISVLSDNQFVNRNTLNETNTENVANIECSGGDNINEKTDEFVNANEVISCEEVSVLNDAVVLADVIDGSSYEISSDGNEDLIFVSDINSEDDRSLSSTLSEKQFDVKKNAVLIRKSPMRFKNLKQFVGVRRPYKVFQNNTVRDDLVSTDDAASDDSDAVYSKLNLTAEEKKLMVKEGIVLPSRYPLTKAEEKELKRIRRKIRNKISAQDSRRRKKEYVDGLEERVKKCSEENAKLMKYIKQLQSQNIALASQVRKLQSASTATTTTTTVPGKNVAQQPQSSTCLLVLFLSLVMVLAPVLKNNTLKNNSVTDDEGISLSDGESSIVSGHSSNVYSGLNSDSAGNEKSESAVLVDGKSFDISKFDTSSMDTVSSIVLDPDEVVSDSIVLRDHDYFRINNKRPASSIGSDSDDLWPTPPSSPPLKVRRSMVEFEGDFIKKLNKSRNSDNNNPIIFELSE